MPKTKAEIVIETIEYYLNPDNRAVRRSGTCAYLVTPKHGPPKKCAVGRCLTEAACAAAERITVHAGALAASLGGDNVSPFALDQFLQEEYRGHDHRFWIWLQNLHDGPVYWNPDTGSGARRRAIQGITFPGGQEILEAVERLGLCALHD